MSAHDLTLAGVEQALNAFCGLDPEIRASLSALHGRVIAFVISGLDLTVYLVPELDGNLTVLDKIEGEPDCTLRGSLLDLLASRGSERGARQLFSGRIEINGDTALARRFDELFAGMDIDWEEQLSRVTGDVLAHQVGVRARQASRYLHDGLDTARLNLGEYLTEEARLTPGKLETEVFLDGVDELRDDVARLEARIARLQRTLQLSRHKDKP